MVVNLSKLVQDFPTSGTESPASQEALSSRKTRIMLQTNLSPFPWCLSLGSPKRKLWDKDLSASSLFWGEGNGNPLQYTCLENPMDGGAW